MQIKVLSFDKKYTYDGTQIIPLWALENFDLSGDSMILFRGPMLVKQKEMVDVKDIVREREYGDILISGDDCLHFIIEMFDNQPANLKLTYHRLHLLCFISKEIIEGVLNVKLKKKGTDLYYQNKKLNVGIATCSNNSSKIHWGINIVSTGVPDHVEAIGLFDIDSKTSIKKLAKQIATRFKEELTAINNDLYKTRTF
ncbi:MAG: DUF366 family protein [Asgard group archaeon]|nr:DUF366 family protein [Asgard group archaeon]